MDSLGVGRGASESGQVGESKGCPRSESGAGGTTGFAPLTPGCSRREVAMAGVCPSRVPRTCAPHACAHRAFARRERGRHLMSLTVATFPAEPEARPPSILCSQK